MRRVEVRYRKFSRAAGEDCGEHKPSGSTWRRKRSTFRNVNLPGRVTSLVMLEGRARHQDASSGGVRAEILSTGAG